MWASPKADAAGFTWLCGNSCARRVSQVPTTPLATCDFSHLKFSAHRRHSIGRMSSLSERTKTVQTTNFLVVIRQAGPISLVDVSGRLTSFEVGALRDSISRLLSQGRKNIVLNLSGLQYLDSSGIGELAKIYVSVVKARGQLKVVGLSRKVEEILKITQLYQVFPEFPNEEAALRSFPESGPKDAI